jgi:hypothetical protein
MAAEPMNKKVQAEVKVHVTLNVKLSLFIPLRFTGGAEI